MTHQHTCRECGYTWDCILQRKGKKTKLCEVERAVRVNKEGPVCLVCYHEEMARRHRELRAANERVASKAVTA